MYLPELQGEDLQKKTYPSETEIRVRVQYYETDRMGVVHHSNYFRYFETARMELLRAWGYPYKEIEDSGILLMIVDMECKCRAPAHYDQVILVRVRTKRMTRYRVVHVYEIRKENGEKVAIGETILASVSREGYPVPLPETLWSIWQTQKLRG